MTTSASEPHGLLVVDKAQGPTSHDVVAWARKALKTRAIGHTGTLDPMATGVLVLAVGEATKLVNMLSASDKAYEATLVLGATTTTLDAEGEITERRDVPPLDLEMVREVAKRFVGELDQRVPAVSAVKVDGQALHKLARKGREVEAPVRRVVVHTLEIRALRTNEIDLAVTCGKGFYVRSLGRDLAEALGTVGHLSALRRTKNGPFALEDAVDFEVLRAAARGSDDERAALRARLLDFDTLCRGLPHVTLDAEGSRHAAHGRAIPLAHVSPALSGSEPHIAFDASDKPIAIVASSGDGAKVLRGFHFG